MINFTFLEVTNKELLEKVFAFRYKILMETYPGYVKKVGITNAKEHDKYDQYAIHFAALDEEKEICATVRLIYHSPVGYPTENSTQFDNSMFERDKLGEMSRIFVDKKYRSIKNTKIIIQAVKEFMYIKMMQEGIEYTYGYLEESFLRLLKIYKMPYHPIGAIHHDENIGLRYPCILYTEELGKANQELIKLWKQKKI
ncbi:GNAT family N-acyltransferase [Sulfurimonas sp.]|uniref:GNAT family N-acyltransferase n=1 Tax=Sulfurimonas sp. TaxID=2022749 RepID=UPI00261EE123|nr:GNAT family N-acyltransferase [Sulfurimonas sp.]